MSEVETIREARIKIDKKDLIIVVRKIARPLSVIAICKNQKSILNISMPLLVKGMNIAIESGNKKTTKTLFNSGTRAGLNSRQIKTLKIKYSRSETKLLLPVLVTRNIKNNDRINLNLIAISSSGIPNSTAADL
jgi:hypothetical protein